MEREQFTFKRSFWEAMKALPKKDQLPFITAILAYVFEEESKPLSGAPYASFLLVKPVLDKASKRAANGKQGGSKAKANAKQIESKTEANTKQTQSKKASNWKQKEGKREANARQTESTPSPLVPPSSSPPDPPISNPPISPLPQPPKAPPAGGWGFGEELDAAFSDWLIYKQEKRQGYKPTGLGSLKTHVRKKAEQYGEAAVAALIRECMAANWQGIIWDRLEKAPVAYMPGKECRQDASDAELPGFDTWKPPGGDEDE